MGAGFNGNCTSVTYTFVLGHMTNESKPVLNLIHFHGVGLIFLTASGVLYQTQAEGLACSHPRVEGVFMPLPVQPGAAELHALTHQFKGAWGHINEESARVVDGILRCNGHGYLTVNRARLHESYEAWIHVLVGEPEKGSIASLAISGFGSCEAILTWPNSD